jgi:hypothetical protein
MKKHLADQYTPTQSEIEEVICESEAFYVGKTATGNLYAGLNGKSYIAFMKAAAGISNEGFLDEEDEESQTAVDEPSRRILRVITMEEGLRAFTTMARAVPPGEAFGMSFDDTKAALTDEAVNQLLRLGYYFQKSFGRDLARAVNTEDETVLNDLLLSITHSIRGFWNVHRARRGVHSKKRTKNDQRILQALEIGRRYYFEHQTDPSKLFIIRELNSKELGFIGANKRQEWDSFMRKVGFEKFPDEDLPATKSVKKLSRKRKNLKPAISRKARLNRD